VREEELAACALIAVVQVPTCHASCLKAICRLSAGIKTDVKALSGADVKLATECLDSSALSLERSHMHDNG
jgi:hypothetical protein